MLFCLFELVLVVEKRQEGTISDLADKNELLIAEKAILENRTEQLIKQFKILESQNKVVKKERDDFNWTLDVILTFNSFPLDKLCPNKHKSSMLVTSISYFIILASCSLKGYG